MTPSRRAAASRQAQQTMLKDVVEKLAIAAKRFAA